MTLASVHMKDVLVAAGYTFAGSADWAIYIGKMPTSPNRVVNINDGPGLTRNPKWLLNYPSIQIKVRGGVNDYQVAGNKMNEISERLIGKASFDALDSSGDRIVAINGMGDYSFLGNDESGRPEWVLNLSLITEPASIPTVSQRETL